ncbi:MAG: metallophosphoesterase [Byssovorax sp.]
MVHAEPGGKRPWSWMVALAVLGAAGCGSSGPVEPNDGGVADAPPDAPPPDGSVAGPDSILAGEILGRPTASSVTVSVVPAVALQMYVEFGVSPGMYDRTTPVADVPAITPFTVVLDQLAPGKGHVYRVRYRRPGDADFAAGEERHFFTQRAPGDAFRFTVQADSHLDENSDLDMYRRALGNMAADAPDFHVDLGDTFMCEKYPGALTAVVAPCQGEAGVDARYLYERANFGLVAHSSPLFLVNGNHDGELGYLLTGTGMDIPTWATLARKKFYLNPTPDGFYSGDSFSEPIVGERASWYSFTWGDALFVMLDPFFYTTKKPKNDGWAWTLGDKQYAFLQSTLAASKATFKFVFLHNLVGGLDGQMRGGVEAAPFFEWGGDNEDGTPGFATHRPGFAKPIHALLVEHGVTAVFHGHDHLYARQSLDGILYQEVPQPSAKNISSGPNLAKTYHYDSGTISSSAGHLRVTVEKSKVTTEYVRAYLPAQETGGHKNGQIDDTFTIPAP